MPDSSWFVVDEPTQLPHAATCCAGRAPPHNDIDGNCGDGDHGNRGNHGDHRGSCNYHGSDGLGDLGDHCGTAVTKVGRCWPAGLSGSACGLRPVGRRGSKWRSLVMRQESDDRRRACSGVWYPWRRPSVVAINTLVDLINWLRKPQVCSQCRLCSRRPFTTMPFTSLRVTASYGHLPVSDCLNNRMVCSVCHEEVGPSRRWLAGVTAGPVPAWLAGPSTVLAASLQVRAVVSRGSTSVECGFR